MLKVDVEGCEVDVLESLAAVLPTVKVLYVEYDSVPRGGPSRRCCCPTHELYSGRVLLDQGEIVYLRADLADLPAATEHLGELLRRSFEASTS